MCLTSHEWDSIIYSWDSPLLLAFVWWRKCQGQPRDRRTFQQLLCLITRSKIGLMKNFKLLNNWNNQELSKNAIQRIIFLILRPKQLLKRVVWRTSQVASMIMVVVMMICNLYLRAQPRHWTSETAAHNTIQDSRRSHQAWVQQDASGLFEPPWKAQLQTSLCLQIGGVHRPKARHASKGSRW